MIFMTVDEVKKAEKKWIDGEFFYIIKVLQQKNVKMGEAAPVVFSDVEFQVLNIYITKMRPQLTGDIYNPVVFPSQSQRASGFNMSYSTFNNILDKLVTRSGKKLSSRIVRGSTITNNRTLNVTHSERLHLAKAMSHSVATAERYYNYSDVSNSVVETLSLRTPGEFNIISP